MKTFTKFQDNLICISFILLLAGIITLLVKTQVQTDQIVVAKKSNLLYIDGCLFDLDTLNNLGRMKTDYEFDNGIRKYKVRIRESSDFKLIAISRNDQNTSLGSAIDRILKVEVNCFRYFRNELLKLIDVQ